jgi:Nucleotidyltransferase of unknown function (DUF6036)
MSRRLSRDDILRALTQLAGLVRSTGSTEIAVMGGAAVVVLYEARASTRDVDIAVLSGDSVTIRDAARRVAAEQELPDDWLNDAAKGYLQGLRLGPVIVQIPSVTIRALAPEQLLAMKLSAWRDDLDVADARLLLSKLSGAKDGIWESLLPHLVPGRELKARYAFDDLWEASRGPS